MVSFGVCLEFEALLKMLTRDIFEYTVKHEDVGQLKPKRFLKRATNKDLLLVFSHKLATVDFEISKPNPHCVLLSDVGQILFFDQHRITNHYIG